MKNYSDEVKEIHHAFNTAGEELLFRVSGIIKSPRRNEILKAKRLREIGFKSAQQAEIIEDKELLNEGEISFEEAEQLHYYQIHYPVNKFITQNQVESICEKYNLFYGDICRYKGFVPEKNLLDIEMFKINPKDVGLEAVSVRTDRSYNDVGGVEPWYIKIKDNGAKAKDRFLPGYKPGEVKAGMKICAPLKDMNLEKFSWVKLFDEKVELPVIDEKDMFQKEALKIVPDPVVLQPVRYGFLIVTAWGDEASDEMVVNPRNN